MLHVKFLKLVIFVFYLEKSDIEEKIKPKVIKGKKKIKSRNQ